MQFPLSQLFFSDSIVNSKKGLSEKRLIQYGIPFCHSDFDFGILQFFRK